MSVLRAIRHASKRLATRVAAWLLRPHRILPEPGPIRRILVIRVDERVGNVLLTTPLLGALHDALPEARIDVLVSVSKAKILEGVEKVIPFDRKAFLRRPWRAVECLATLRRNAYDVAIDASHWHQFSVTSALLLAWTRAPTRIAHARGDAGRFASRLIDAPPDAEPEIVSKLRLGTPLGLPLRARPMFTGLGLTGPGRRRMDDWLSHQGLTDAPLVALAPGSRKHDHRADPELFAALGREAAAAGAMVLVLWGPGEEELAGQVREACDGRLAPPTDLDELAALMRRCAVVITNDTGPMHLSVACGAPTLALFRGGRPERWGHREPPNAVISTDDHGAADVLDFARAALRKMLRPASH